MSSTGHDDLEVELLAGAGVDELDRGRSPETKRATSSSGRCVADRPMRATGFLSSASRRSSESDRCAPRLLPATACTSSTMTVSTPRSVSRGAT